MSSSNSQSLTHNAVLLRSKASRYAITGAVIAVIALISATLIASYVQTGAVTLNGIAQAQRNNFALWILDVMPFVFAVWGQYVSSLMAYEAGAMVVDQTSELRAQTAALEHQVMHDVTHDPLTNLPNRVLFHDRLLQAVSAAYDDKYHLGVLLMDLDGFKEINDTLGQYNGDRLLKQLSIRLSNTVQERDTVARIGGDEFAILLHKIRSADDTVQVAQKIQKALQAPFTLEGMKIDIRASTGITIFPDHGPDPDTLLQRAEIAMYAAKRDKSGFAIYDSKFDDDSPFRLTVMAELRQAIETGELVLHYQPKINACSGHLTGFEALVRWQHPQHNLMRPDDFIPLAERTGLIKLLTRWVLNQSLQQCSSWRRDGRDISVAVNLSAQDLHDLELPDLIAGLLAANNIPASQLMLEITETSIMLDHDRALQVLMRLAEIGVRLSIDDFGTGYSSLSYLSDLPVHEIKIDRSFVSDMVVNSKHATIVHATIDLAHNLNLDVVAEGVEDRQTFHQLQALNCDTVQGYYVTRPLSIEDLSGWMHQIYSKQDGKFREPATETQESQTTHPSFKDPKAIST